MTLLDHPKELTILNAMSVDVEEHFQVSGFDDVISRASWEHLPSRVRENTTRLLDLFEGSGVKATFFVLGWVAERSRGLVQEISSRGHEIASHGYSHRLVYEQSEGEFRQETLRSRALLQDLSGQPVLGYRAASFSIGRANLWALDVLAGAGFRYDSSLFPIVHDRYGVPGAPRQIHELTAPCGLSLVEVPPCTVSVFGNVMPVGGGGYLRLFPEGLTRWAFRRLNRQGTPGVVYVHPWEVDPGQPRIKARSTARFRHYTGLRTTVTKLRGLMSTFSFGPIREVLSANGFHVDVSSMATAEPIE